jgi:hypothetical protein
MARNISSNAKNSFNCHHGTFKWVEYISMSLSACWCTDRFTTKPYPIKVVASETTIKTHQVQHWQLILVLVIHTCVWQVQESTYKLLKCAFKMLHKLLHFWMSIIMQYVILRFKLVQWTYATDQSVAIRGPDQSVAIRGPDLSVTIKGPHKPLIYSVIMQICWSCCSTYNVFRERCLTING